MIIHKYGSKLEQASTFIDDLESQLEAAKQALENTRTHSDSEISFSNDYTTYTPQSQGYGQGQGHGQPDAMSLKNSERKCKELEAKIVALQSELNRDKNGNEPDAEQIMSDLISYKMQFAMAASDVENEKKKNKDAKVKLQTFAKRISVLENALADANEQTSLANEPKGMFSYFRRSEGSVTGGSVVGSSHGGNTPNANRNGPSPGGPGPRPNPNPGLNRAMSGGQGRSVGVSPNVGPNVGRSQGTGSNGGPSLQAVRR